MITWRGRGFKRINISIKFYFNKSEFAKKALRSINVPLLNYIITSTIWLNLSILINYYLSRFRTGSGFFIYAISLFELRSAAAAKYTPPNGLPVFTNGGLFIINQQHLEQHLMQQELIIQDLMDEINLCSLFYLQNVL